jgi:hypothetical protein
LTVFLSKSFAGVEAVDDVRHLLAGGLGAVEHLLEHLLRLLLEVDRRACACSRLSLKRSAIFCW